jgi:hypothetical protein
MSPILGSDRLGIPSANAPGGTVHLTYVLVMGHAQDVACYVGEGTPEWVAFYGDKVSVEEAELHFPALRQILADKGWTYRR